MTRSVPPVKFAFKAKPKSVEAGTLMQVAVDRLEVLKNFNLRVELPDIESLARSIERHGFYPDKPLAGYLTSDDTVIVVDGHRRLAAVHLLIEEGHTFGTLPVVVKPEASSSADLMIAMMQSATGEPLKMFEKGIGVRRLMADGMSKEDVARALAVTEKTIDNYLLVSGVKGKARDLLLDNKVTSTQVLRTKGDDDKLTRMVEKATAAGRSRARPSDAEPPAERTALSVSGRNDLPAESHDLSTTVEILQDADMAAMLKQVATFIRSHVRHDRAGDDVALQPGKVRITLVLGEATEPDLLAHAIPSENDL